MLIHSGLASELIAQPNRLENNDLISRPCIETSRASLQGLDKITGRVLTIEATIGQPILFGTLHIKVLKCLKTKSNDTSDSAAFVEVREQQLNREQRIVFNGWMFASHPSLSAPEHPVYDIWIQSCTDDKPPSINAIETAAEPNEITIQHDSDQDRSTGKRSVVLPLLHPDDVHEVPPAVGPTLEEQQQLDALYRGIDKATTE